MHLPQSWQHIRGSYDYAVRLSPAEREAGVTALLPPIVDRRRISKYGAYSVWKRKQQARVKAKTDVFPSFPAAVDC